MRFGDDSKPQRYSYSALHGLEDDSMKTEKERFKLFQATGRGVPNVEPYLQDYVGPGRLYCNDLLYIGETSNWPEEHNARGNKWYLQIGNQEWLSNNLEELEYELFLFAESEGYL